MKRLPLRLPAASSRRVLARLPGILLAVALASPAVAQTVRGRVTEETGGPPLSGVLVALLPPDGDSVHAATLTDPSGAFVLRSPPGRWRLRGEMVGFRTADSRPFDVPARGQARVDLVLRREVVPLEGLDVTVSSRCVTDPDEGPVVAAAWGEARKALELSRWSEQEFARFEAFLWERTLDPSTLEVREERRERRSGQGGRPFETANPESLAADGFVQRTDSGTYYFGLDERVLLSDAFLDGHCFGLRRADSLPALLGLTFQPVRRSENVDVTGVLWLDGDTREIRVLDFSYLGLNLGVDTDGVGGRVEFQRLPTGAWISRRWWIRMPIIAEHRTPLVGRDREIRRLELAGLLERGGEVETVLTRTGMLLDRLDRPRVQGVVWDSVGARPLPGAEVFLTGTEYAGRTDEHGHFLIVATEGDFQLSFSHPLLDTLGVRPEPRPVSMRPGVVRQVRLAVPTQETLLAGTCAAPGPVVVTGTVRGGADEPLPGAEVRLSWRADTDQLIRRGSTTDGRGRFVFCEAPPELPLLVRALFEGATSEPLVTSGAPGEVLRIHMLVDSLRTGSLRGRVTDLTTGAPVVQATIRLRGTEIEGNTDQAGRFILLDLPPGRRALEVSHLLYGSRVDSLRVRPDSTVTLEVALTTDAIELEPITVTVRQYRTPGQAAFHERMERGLGQYVTADQIELSRAHDVTDILRRVPGLGVGCGTPDVLGSGCIIQFERARTMDIRGRERVCPVQFFLDGSTTSQEIIESLRPESIEGIEIYNGLSEVPPRLRRGPDTRCGVIAVWLKSGR